MIQNLVSPDNRLTVYTQLSVKSNVYSPFYPLFSLYTNTSPLIGISSVLLVFRLFRKLSVSFTYLFAYSSTTYFIAFTIALLRSVIVREGLLKTVIRRYIPNTRRVRISPSGPVVSFTVLTIICKICYLAVFGNSSVIISNIRRKGIQYYSTRLMEQYTSIRIYLVVLPIDVTFYLNSELMNYILVL